MKNFNFYTPCYHIFRTPIEIQLYLSLKWLEIFGKINPFFSTLQVVPVMPPCVTSAMSVGNLNQIRDGNGTSAVSQSNNNNNSINSGNINNINNNNNNRVSSAVSAGNVSKIHTTKVTGELNVLSMMCFCVCLCAQYLLFNYEFNTRW